MDQLSPPQHEILHLIHQYIEENDGRPPYRNNMWFEDRTQYQGNYITNIKSELRRLQFVDDQLRLTEKGKAYIRFFFGSFTVQGVSVHVQGTAQAGPSNFTYIDIEELDRPSDESILIPNTFLNKDVFAVRVEGTSMEAMGILSGDYVIIERQDSLWWPDIQDLIVTRYLPHDPKRNSEVTPDLTDYVGPVVKVYLKRFEEKGCYLGWRKSNNQNPNLIEADDIMPIGKVIGSYRDYRNFKLPSSFLPDV